MFIPPFPYDAPPYDKLRQILGCLDIDTQKAIVELSEQTAQHYCDKKADQSDLLRSYAYLYALSKRVKEAVSCYNIFDDSSVFDYSSMKDVQEIKDYYTRKLSDLLYDSTWRYVNGDIIKPIPVILT